ncbi:nuclear transport factor 2 family protein [Streptomyces acidiscabies]|uniref:SnoaL-like domain-containing protein n=1 Tax=Streptomyces acidiscabies TaxID=42234 RepID=A0A0L0JRL6_9ACTN|nr:nuclear transport factor 2 family protein [Streptomyces acidiscabies]KND28206.1 hypothetical protein IQ63_33880 [Streptomyces acidiscabies]
MSVDKAAISKTVLELEKSFDERWSAGDNRGYLDNYAEVIAYIDSVYTNPHIVRSEYLNPVVHVSEGGDFAVLAYNLDTYVFDDDGKERQLRAWNSTEAYRLVDGEWRIVHSNWAFSQTTTEAIAS